jgi:hypothetical protein
MKRAQQGEVPLIRDSHGVLLSWFLDFHLQIGKGLILRIDVVPMTLFAVHECEGVTNLDIQVAGIEFLFFCVTT